MSACNTVDIYIIATLDSLSIGLRTNFFWSASRQVIMSICARIGLDFHGLMLVLSFYSLSTFLKMVDFQGRRYSSDFHQVTNLL